MMEGLWTLFCGRSDHSSIGTSEPCAANLVLVIQPSSCVNHATIIFVDILILAAIIFNIIWKIFSKKKFETPARYGRFSTLQIASAVFNGCLGLVYIGLGIWILEGKRRKDHSASPVHWWLLYLFQGFTWLSLGLTSLKGEYFLRAWLRILSIFTFFAAGIICFLAFSAAIIDHQTTVKEALDILSFLGASLLLLSMYGYKVAGNGVAGSGSTLYTPLIGEANSSCKNDSASRASAYAKAGLFSKLTFWWLNSLMKLGKQKILEEEEIPKLQDVDRAEFCYLQYMKHLSKQQLNERPSQPSLFWTIVACHWNDILLSGFFALLKTLAMSVGPLLLKAFIRVAEGKEAFKYEGYLLAFALFFSKNIESLSHRQWLFRSKLIGLKVKSLLTAAIYRKQLRLSNAAKMTHSAGEIMNYVTVDAYRIGEFPVWSHQTWTTCLQLCIALLILVHSVGQATIATLIVIVITVLFNIPLTKLQHKYQSKYRVAQGARLKACSEAFVSMKVLKLYAWENHFKGVIERLRKEEINWLSALQIQKTCSGLLFALSPVLISAATFGACYFLKVPLHASNVFTFLATVRLVQEPVRSIPEVISVVIQARVALTRIVNFLDASELQTDNVKKQICKDSSNHAKHAIMMRSANLSWDMNPSKLTLKNINLDVQPGEKVAICGEVGSGKSTLLAAILGEVPCMEGTVEVYGKIAYVSQTAWIQTGTIRDNVLFGSSMDEQRYQDTLRRCSLMKDLELLPFGDMTEIGERGINLSGGQKQRIQLARALYQDADIYLLDDPFSAVDAHTASSLIREYVMEALCRKTVLLVTHQVDFLPAFHCCMLMSGGQILQSGSYHDLLASSREFLDLVDAHKETVGKKFVPEVKASRRHNYHEEEIKITNVEQYKASEGNQLIKREEREVGDTGFKPYLLYLNQNKGYWYLSIAVLCQFASVAVSTLQSTWIASSVDNPHISALKLILVYLILGGCYAFALLFRLLSTIILGMKASESLFTQLLSSLFRAPMHFYDSTPLGRIISRVSSDLSIVDLDVPYNFMFTIAVATSLLNTIGVLTVISWQVLLVSVPVIYMAILLQRYYFAASKELMRINGTTKSFVASHLAETMAGAMIIRAFGAEEQFFAKNFDIIDRNASPFFHNFAANEWLIQRLETLSAIVLMTASLCLVMLPIGTFSSGLIGMMLSYGLTLNMIMVLSIQLQCGLANQIISVERLDQYMHVPEEPLEVIVENRPPENWPSVGKVEICNLQIKYRPDTPLVLKGISCTFEGGDKIGIVGRTGSGKTTLLGALFRLMEPTGGKIVVDGIDICSIGLHDLRSRVGIIPQDPTLFNGSVRFNLDPLCRHNDEELWEVLGKCQLKETVQEKEQGLESFVMEDGSNWSMGQRQLFCLGRAMLRRSRVLVLDEATASIDNATDTVLQKTIRTEFAGCTVITVAHRIPTVMDCTKVLAISDGKLVEFDEPTVLMKKENSLFGQLVKEYWSHFQYADQTH